MKLIRIAIISHLGCQRVLHRISINKRHSTLKKTVINVDRSVELNTKVSLKFSLMWSQLCLNTTTITITMAVIMMHKFKCHSILIEVNSSREATSIIRKGKSLTIKDRLNSNELKVPAILKPKQGGILIYAPAIPSYR